MMIVAINKLLHYFSTYPIDKAEETFKSLETTTYYIDQETMLQNVMTSSISS